MINQIVLISANNLHRAPLRDIMRKNALEAVMLLTDEKFYLEVLNTDIPELALAAERWRSGKAAEAERTFADYIKSVLKPELYFQTPATDYDNQWKNKNESEVSTANRICEGKLMSCGVMHDFGSVDRVNWEHNPTYNGYEEWPWQLNRHPEFQLLGSVYRKTGDEKYACAYATLLRSWIESAECPEDISGYKTITWRTIEAGIRMAKNWHAAIHAFLYSPSVDDRLWVLTFKSVWEHAYRLTKNPTKNNWLIMEMTGLIHIANMYPFFRESETWREYGFRRMTEEHSIQIYEDGFQFELSSGYHWVCIMNYQFVIDNSLLYGTTIPKEFMDGIRKMYSIYPKLVRPDGKLPDINDGGCPSVSKLMDIGLHYFPDDGELLAFRDGIGRENFVPKTVVMPYSGMTVMRDGFENDGIWAFFESAPFGKSHQHEDKLNFLLYAYGKNMLDDSGNFIYDTSDMRKYILSTRSHNTGLVDGMGQNRRKYYHWEKGDIQKLSDLSVEERDGVTVASGVYREGYGPNLIPVTHKRTVYFYRNGIGGSDPFFVLHDHFSAEDGCAHTYEVSFQLGREPLTIKNGKAIVDHGDGISLCIAGTGTMTTITASKNPFMGFRKNTTPGDVEHYPAPVLSFSANGKNANFATVLYPAKGPAPEISVKTEAENVLLTLNGIEYPIVQTN